MTERLLQFIWQFQYFNRNALQTTDGEAIAIIHSGVLNKNQGPDFSAAKIKIGQTLFAGAVELHLRTSDWNAHQHSDDKNYNNVILHVVWQHDQFFQNPIPVLELEPRVSQHLLERYAYLMEHQDFIPCAGLIHEVPQIVWESWKERLVAQRLMRKAMLALQHLENTKGDWEETGWRLLARHFGATVNSDAFENIAVQLPLKLLTKHRHHLLQMEALLLGMAHLLEGAEEDDYVRTLQREFSFLQEKYGLKKAAMPVYFLRMRPPNFPTIRLAQLAALIEKEPQLFSKLIEAETVTAAASCFDVVASAYWNNHYVFGEASVHQPKHLGKTMIQNILINTVAPLLFAYGHFHQNEAFKEKAIQWLQELAPEKNNITSGFVQLGIANKNAFDSQAMIELKPHYCDVRKCLECAVGNSLMRRCA